MDKDQFKYHNFNHLPSIYGDIKVSSKGKKYAVKFDNAADFSQSFYLFSKAFYASADLIINRMLDGQQIDELDRYFFPVFYLYRHSLELLLKSIGFKTIVSKPDRISFLSETFHNLNDILLYIKDRATIERPTDEILWLQKYFSNISTFDSASDSFRYPYHIIRIKNVFGETEYVFTRVFQKQTHIDLIGEANKMIAAYEILENWYLDYTDENKIHKSTEYISLTSDFLEEGGNYFEQSVVGYEYQHNDFYSHCSGYQECANFLKQYLINEWDNGNKIIGHMIYPMCYLYRNDIELLLKSIIFEFSVQPFQKVLEILYINKHRIINLFQYVEDNILDIYKLEKSDSYIVNAKCYCSLLHNFDTDSSKFRYPVNRRCDPYQASIRYYNFDDLSVFLDSLCNAIDGIHGEIDSRKSALDEMASEYASYY